MAGRYVLYGARGFGSVVVEAALTLMGEPFERVDVADGAYVHDDERVTRINPLKQVPALVLPSGELMTESAAILLWLAEQHPQAGLAPPPGDPARGQFLRWMVYVPAQIYSMYWVRDIPSRLADGAEAEQVILSRTAERIADCWKMMDEQVSPGRYILGDALSVLDLYVTVVSRWTPRRRRFYAVAPKMAQVVKRVDAEPRLAAFWAERMPFEEGWEG
ncbi:glutathione S-transferase family protein [Phenylobacterium sp.]|uniref:glutathione S-transferase family protein n=1 Tax=Phenylobacterium sp. TaxID=1871053 RepID=UPI002D1C5481|nr:glutathione S-transferase family protein [Phenylobacterium sp.]HVI31136.1 glutathione S-transferase family protein [Phenylobacterium sp.]